MSFLDDYSKEQIQNILNISISLQDALTKIDKSKNSGPNYSVFLRYIKKNKDLNLDKMLQNKKEFSEKLEKDKYNTILCKDSKVSQHLLRSYVKRNHLLKDDCCAICNMKPIWNNKELIFRLDHIDGNNNNNVLENLRWICPNCDSQLPTYGARNKTKKHFCSMCGKTLNRKTKTGLCQTCYHMKKNDAQKKNGAQMKKRKFCLRCGNPITHSAKTYCQECYKIIQHENSKIPEKKILITDIRTLPFVKIGKKYGVSDKAIVKWCKYYKLPYKTSEIKSMTENDWNKLLE